MEALSLIDVSAEDDLFLGLASPPALAQPPDREPPRAGEQTSHPILLPPPFWELGMGDLGVEGIRRCPLWLRISGSDDGAPFVGFRVGAVEAAAELGAPDDSTAAEGRTADLDGVREDQTAPELAESPKQRKAKTGVNLRKSLAWDSAFFTSEGWHILSRFLES